MKTQPKILSIVLMLTMVFGLSACSLNTSNPANTPEKPAGIKTNASTNTSEKATPGIKIKVTIDERVLTATLIDNATTRSLISKFPLTVPMTNLYSREMAYRFPDPLPAKEAQQSGYEVGDLSYWTPRHSLVIFYKQNGEVISKLQKIGHFDSNLEFLNQTGDTEVKFELLDK